MCSTAYEHLHRAERRNPWSICSSIPSSVSRSYSRGYFVLSEFRGILFAACRTSRSNPFIFYFYRELELSVTRRDSARSRTCSLCGLLSPSESTVLICSISVMPPSPAYIGRSSSDVACRAHAAPGANLNVPTRPASGSQGQVCSVNFTSTPTAMRGGRRSGPTSLLRGAQKLLLYVVISTLFVQHLSGEIMSAGGSTRTRSSLARDGCLLAL